MSRYILRTLGCKANLYDSQFIEYELQKRGWLPESQNTDTISHESKIHPSEEVHLCIINSCTVTNEADRQTRKMAQRLARENPHAAVVVTGCAAEVNPEALAQSPGVHYVVGNQNKNELVDLVLGKIDSSIKPQTGQILGSVQDYESLLSRHPMDREWPAVTESFLTPPPLLKGFSGKTRVFLKIQEGCNAFCTYCIIPYGRGPHRSLRPRELIQQVRELVQSGVREVVLTGTNIGDYGTDWSSEPKLGELIELILNETTLERLRVSSLDPTEISPQIMTLMERNPRFCPHFHVSLQSPHSRILKLMKRKYGFQEVKDCLERISCLPAPVGGVFVGMDVITGFPGETDEEFEWTYQALTSLPWTRLHVFPYSEREGTPATRLPGSVPKHIRAERTQRLNTLSLSRLTQHYRQVLEKCLKEEASLHSILLENKGKGSHWRAGYTPNYLRILVDQPGEEKRNDGVNVQPIDIMIDPKANDVALVSKICKKTRLQNKIG